MPTGTDIGLFDKQAQGVEGLTATNTWNGVTDAVANRYKSQYEYDANGNIQSAKRWDNAGTQYDDLKYNYEKSGTQLLRNRLYHLNETKYGGYDDIGIDISEYHNDHEDVNLLNNYRYDALGNLIQDKREKIANIEWTVSGKVKRITRTADSTKPPLEFAYGADGQRISKTVGDPLNGGYREYYLRDAQGNIMAMYRHTNTGPKSLKVTERPVYGSSRIGSYTGQMELAGEQAITSYPYTQPMSEFLKRYELTDHLGNVATVVTGRLLDGAGAGGAKQAEVVSAQGYEAFGSLLPGRNYSSDSYRFGFNGMEKDDELYGSPGTSYDFGARMYDSRVGRFLSIDPKTVEYSENSPYSYAANNPIYYVDKQGKNPVVFVEFVWEGGTALLALVGITAVGLIVKDAMFGAHTSWSTPLFASRYKDNPGFKDQQRRERMYGDFARIRDIAFAESVRRNLPNPGPDGSDPNGYERISRTIGKVGAITLGLTEVLQNMRNIAIEEKGALEDNLADKQSYIKAKEGTSMAPGDQAKFNAIQALIPDIQDKIQARQDVIDFTDNLIKESQSKADYENPQISRQDNTRVGSGISGGQ